MYTRGITILLREDSAIEKGRKKFIKVQCTAANHSDGVGVNELMIQHQAEVTFRPLC